MKLAIAFGMACSLVLGALPASAEQTLPEKAKVVKNDAGRAVKKAYHRVQEVVCLKSDLECLARKAEHRVEEAADATGDKVDEVKDKLDK